MLRFTDVVLLAAGATAASAVLVACGGSSNKSAASTSSSGSSTDPASSFSTANVSGVGDVVVDGKGRTVYILTSGGHSNVPCTGANGCAKLWPALPLPSGVTSAKAGTGTKGSLLGTKKGGDGHTYPTYNGWSLYEYAGDSGSGQANGEGIKSFGGTWYVLNASGNPVRSKSGGGGGYRY